MRLATLAAFLLALASLAAGQISAQSTAPWDYEGKRGSLNWGKLDPDYKACSKGREQSPLDIHGAHLNKALQPIEFHYLAGQVTLEHTGNTIRVYPNPGSYIVA